MDKNNSTYFILYKIFQIIIDDLIKVGILFFQTININNVTSRFCKWLKKRIILYKKEKTKQNFFFRLILLK